MYNSLSHFPSYSINIVTCCLLLYLRMLAREAALSEVNFCAAEVDEKSDHHYPIFQENRNQTKRWMSQTLCKYCIYFF